MVALWRLLVAVQACAAFVQPPLLRSASRSGAFVQPPPLRSASRSGAGVAALSRAAPPRTGTVVAAEPAVEDQVALGGDVACLFLYSYTQRLIDSIFALAAMATDSVTADEMDFFSDPSFGAAMLAAAWLAAATTQGGFRFASTRNGVTNALVTVARGGGLALTLVIAALYARSAALGLVVCPQDVGFAAGILPIIGAWRYVLAETTDLP